MSRCERTHSAAIMHRYYAATVVMTDAGVEVDGVAAVLYLEGVCLHLHQKVIVGGTAIHLEKLYLAEVCILLHGIHHLPCLLDMISHTFHFLSSRVCLTHG